MNAPENIATINAAHGVLLKAKDAMCVTEVARAMGTGKPTASKQLKELYDLGMIESKPRQGGTPYYLLIVEPQADMGNPMSEGEQAPAVCDPVQTKGSAQTEAPEPELVLTPEAQAERDQFVAEHGHDGNCSCHISPPCGSCMHPGNPRNQEEDEAAWMDAPAEDYVPPPADPALLALANRGLHNQLEAKDAKLLSQAQVIVDLRQRITDLDEQVSSLTTDVTQTRTALNHAINEADRLRGELGSAVAMASRFKEETDAIKRAWKDDAMDVKDAAVGYLVRAPKRKPRYVTKPEKAQAAALAAVRGGAARADVLALVPVGVARRGAEWQGIQHLAKGD